MLTDDRTIHDILSAVEHSRIPPLESVKAICTRVLEAEARVKKLEAEIVDMKRKKQTDQILAFGAGALLF